MNTEVSILSAPQLSASEENELQGLRERGFALHESGDLSGAERAYREVMRRGTRDLEVLHACGVLCLQTGRYGEALEFITAVMADRELPGLHGELGTALLGLSRFEEAIGSYERALELQPNLSSAHLNRGHALRALGRNEEALTAYERAIGSSPQFFEAQVGKAEVLLDLGQRQEALESYDRAIAIRPDGAETYLSRGNLFADLNQWESALASYDQSILLNARYAEAYSNRGNVLKELGRWEAALASYNHAIDINPGLAEPYYTRGNVLRTLKRYEAAIASYDQAIALQPESKFLLGTHLHTALQICDWHNLDSRAADLTARIERGRRHRRLFRFWCHLLRRHCTEVQLKFGCGKYVRRTFGSRR